MRSAHISFVAVAVAVACSPSYDRPTALPAANFPSVYNDPAGVDTGAGRLPDLVVDPRTTQNNWLVRAESFPANACSVIEGDVTPGDHRVLRFTVTTPNIGTADNFIGNPQDHVDANDGLYEFAECHAHYHFQNYTLYELVDPATGHVWRSAKRGFCMLDTDPAAASYGIPPRDPLYGSCGSTASAGFQGISRGWSDTYVWQLAGQYFVLDGGDGQPAVPAGTYLIRITVNPPYAPDASGTCPRVTAPDGSCRQFAELSYDNNVWSGSIVVPANVGRDGYGPLKGAAFTGEVADHADKR